MHEHGGRILKPDENLGNYGSLIHRSYLRPGADSPARQISQRAESKDRFRPADTRSYLTNYIMAPAAPVAALTLAASSAD